MNRAVTGSGLAICRAAVQHSGLREEWKGRDSAAILPPRRGGGGRLEEGAQRERDHARAWWRGTGQSSHPHQESPPGGGGSRSETEGGSAKTAAPAAARDRALATQPPPTHPRRATSPEGETRRRATSDLPLRPHVWPPPLLSQIHFGVDCLHFVLAVWESPWHYAKN